MKFLDHPETERIIRAALREDIGDGDHTSLSTILPSNQSQAQCIIKDKGVLAGVALAEKIFQMVDDNIVFVTYIADGETVSKGDVAFIVSGSAQHILQCERLVLNLMQRMSGIATKTREVVSLLEGTQCKVLDTRKTTPLIRHMEKWAVDIGGGVNHRFGLYDMIMIKDNHIDMAGGIPQAMKACKKYLHKKGLDLKIIVETRNLDEVQMVLDEGGAHRILLDNMSPLTLRKAVRIIKGSVATEASGGITLETVREVAETGVDFVSMGALTHSVKSMDISLKAFTGESKRKVHERSKP